MGQVLSFPIADTRPSDVEPMESEVRCAECDGLFDASADPQCEVKRGGVIEHVCEWCREALREQEREFNREQGNRYRSNGRD